MHIFNASKCGDNCAKWLLEIAKRHEEQGLGDVTVAMFHVMEFPKPFKVLVGNTNQIVDNWSALAILQDKFCR